MIHVTKELLFNASSMKGETGSLRFKMVLAFCAVFPGGIMTFKHWMTEFETDSAPLSVLADIVPGRFIIVKGFVHFLQCSLDIHFKVAKMGLFAVRGVWGSIKQWGPHKISLLGLAATSPFNYPGKTAGAEELGLRAHSHYSTCISFFQYFEIKVIYIVPPSLSFLQHSTCSPKIHDLFFFVGAYMSVCINMTCSVHWVFLMYFWFLGWPFDVGKQSGTHPWRRLLTTPALSFT